MRMENPVSWVIDRMEDASAAEKIIALGCSEYIGAFGVIWKTTEDAGLAEKEAIKYMLNVRKDLEIMRRKMHDPSRMFANRHLNAALAGLLKLTRT